MCKKRKLNFFLKKEEERTTLFRTQRECQFNDTTQVGIQKVIYIKLLEHVLNRAVGSNVKLLETEFKVQQCFKKENNKVNMCV